MPPLLERRPMSSHTLFFPDLVPSNKDYAVCTNAMTKIFDLAPSDSSVQAFINLLADGTYHTVIAINALIRPFKSEAKTSSLSTSLIQAQQNMLAALADWKKGRFEIR